MKAPLKKITICMGSSCFSRGNNRNIEVVQSFLRSHGLEGALELSGHHCEGLCKEGPNITVNGNVHHRVNPIQISGLLEQYEAPSSE